MYKVQSTERLNPKQKMKSEMNKSEMSDGEKLRQLADWFDNPNGSNTSNEFKVDLRRIASDIDRKHSPSCNIMQDWSEAEAAFADTPNYLRDFEWNEARNELDVMRNTCTCKKDDINLKAHIDGVKQMIELAEKSSFSLNDITNALELMKKLPSDEEISYLLDKTNHECAILIKELADLKAKHEYAVSRYEAAEKVIENKKELAKVNSEYEYGVRNMEHSNRQMEKIRDAQRLFRESESLHEAIKAAEPS